MLLAVSEEAKTFFFVQCIIKLLLDSVFVISRIIKVPVRVISLRLITLTSTLIILDSLRRRANARNVSFRISLRWTIHIINQLIKTNYLDYSGYHKISSNNCLFVTHLRNNCRQIVTVNNCKKGFSSMSLSIMRFKENSLPDS